MTSPVVFDIKSAYEKLYEANGEKEVVLTAYEAEQLLDYIDHMSWLASPAKTSFVKRIKAVFAPQENCGVCGYDVDCCTCVRGKK